MTASNHSSDDQRGPLSHIYTCQKLSLQEQPNSTIVQTDGCRKYAVKHQADLPPQGPVWSDINVADDHRFEERPRGGPLLRALLPGDALVVWRPDRFGRNYWQDDGTVAKLIAKKVTVIVLIPHAMEAIDLDTPGGKIMWSIMGLAAEMERESGSDRMLESKAYLKMVGRSGTAARIGKKNELRPGPHGRMVNYPVVDFEFRAVLARLKQWRFAGLSLAGTAAAANSQGWRTQRGVLWNEANVSETLIKYKKWIADENNGNKEANGTAT